MSHGQRLVLTVVANALVWCCVQTTALAERIPRDVFCDPATVANTILQNQAFDFACDKLPWVLGEACEQGNPFPSNEDIWNFCVDCPLSEATGGPPCPDYWGDTHVTTIDGLRYDFQAQGDYAAIVADELEVQIRLVGRGVSYIDGVAVRHRDVHVSIDDSRNPKTPVHIGGRSVSLASGDWYEVGDGGAFVQRMGNAYLIDIPGVIRIGIRGSGLLLKLDEGFPAEVVGLSGDGDGDPSNDLRTAGGQSVDAGDPGSVYGRFMKDWRRDGERSLFATPFEYDGDPDEIGGAVKRLADIPAKVREEARERCLSAGVTREAGLDECVYDLAITGDDRFLADSRNVQERVARTISAVALTSDDITVFEITPGETVRADGSDGGAGRIERPFSIHRFRIEGDTDDQLAVRLHAPCDGAASVMMLQRTDGGPVRESVLDCGPPVVITSGVRTFDLYGPGGDTFDYSFSLVAGAALASLEGPRTVEAGSPLLVAWDGPAEDGDWISLSSPVARAGRWESRAVVQGLEGPARLRAPGEPGSYELRYVLESDREVLAREPIEVTAASAAIDGPSAVEAGAGFEVRWTGPANEGDWVGIASPGSRSDKWESRAVAKGLEGPAQLRAPGQPGAYELRYVLDADRVVLAREPIEVTAASATIDGPSAVEAGTTFEVRWTGPANEGDWIGIASPESRSDKWRSRAVAKGLEGPARLRAPGQPGMYELRYVLSSDRVALVREPIEVTAASATLEGPSEVEAGTTFEVRWTGPANEGDWISLSSPASRSDKWKSRAVVTDLEGPALLQAPDEPGAYELRYVLSVDRQVIARIPIRVE